MPDTDTVILSSGGVKSLVAAASIGGSKELALCFAHDGRPSVAEHHAAFLRQCEHFQPGRRIELNLPHLVHGGAAPLKRSATATFELLLAAAGAGLRFGAKRLVWPVRLGPDFDAVARIAEALVMVEHAVEIESRQDIRIETPLLEMTWSQVLELGHQMNVPWRATRSCLAPDAEPCNDCPGCHERTQAFTEACLDDPLAARA